MKIKNLCSRMYNDFDTYRHFQSVQHFSVLVSFLNEISNEKDLLSKEKNFSIVLAEDEAGKLYFNGLKCGEKMKVFLNKSTKSESISGLEFLNEWARLASDLNILKAGNTIALQNGKVKLTLDAWNSAVEQDLNSIPEFEGFKNHA